MTKITKRVHAGRGQETKWEIPIEKSDLLSFYGGIVRVDLPVDLP